MSQYSSAFIQVLSNASALKTHLVIATKRRTHIVYYVCLPDHDHDHKMWRGLLEVHQTASDAVQGSILTKGRVALSTGRVLYVNL